MTLGKSASTPANPQHTQTQYKTYKDVGAPSGAKERSRRLLFGAHACRRNLPVWLSTCAHTDTIRNAFVL